jgi:DNA-binding transcriptional regulator GbsR (MarR family)/predicted DCC family thiol-disulfide oxidoreductase YuxK
MKALSPVQQKFILHWGEMGTRWGINRTVAQIHALLFIAPRPLNAEEIAETLSVARSNVSNSLRELQGWGIVKLTHVMGDKRDHFESMKEVWEMFRVVLDERKKREIDPTLALLKECIAEAEKDEATDEYTEQRLRDLHGFFDLTTSWYGQIRLWPTSALTKFIKLGDKVRKLVGIGSWFFWILISVNTEITDGTVDMALQWVAFDAECVFCMALARRLEPALRRRGFALVPLQTPWVKDRLGQIPGESVDEMKLLTTNGGVVGGADAAVELGRAVWILRPLVWMSGVPGGRWFLQWAYRWIARHRRCGDGIWDRKSTRLNSSHNVW